MDCAKMAQVLAGYAETARRAERLGIDLLEIHAAHGYLLHSFLSPLSNQRNDEYGGPLEGRMRFVLEVFRTVRDAWPSPKPLGVRISATDWIEGGWSIEDSVTLARRLKALGCDYITASSGGILPAEHRRRAGVSSPVCAAHPRGSWHSHHGRRIDYAGATS
jgi:2,4-dienoyl-CoA reductase-like NADH-dependent reductase (Old Yellow Enzyme family)